MSELTWEQKLAALNALTPTDVKMREPGDWYVSAYARSIPEGQVLRGAYGNGSTPQEAVEDDWRQITEAVSVRVSGSISETEYRWAGFMWKQIPISK